MPLQARRDLIFYFTQASNVAIANLRRFQPILCVSMNGMLKSFGLKICIAWEYGPTAVRLTVALTATASDLKTR